ncbi:MAG TPA: S53 family peptidase [Trebonia sp.]|nr:S53 family peptidase [Trebonia sp.]
MAILVRPRLWAGLAACVLAVAAPVAATAGTAQASSSQQLPTGLLASAVPGASAFGTTPSSTQEQVSFIMKENNVSRLSSAVTSGLTRFDTVSQFAARYGASRSAISALTSYLASFGIKTSVYAGNVDVSASGTAGEFDAALSVTTKNYHVPARHGIDGHKIPAQSVYSATGAPDLPAPIGRSVLAVLGLTNYAPFSSNAVHEPADVKVKPSSSSGDQPGDFLPSDFAARYGLSPLYKKGDGAGETLGIVTLAAVDPGAPQYFWQNVANVPSTGRTLTVDNVDGGPGAPSDASGTGETDLDIEQSGALAPGANVIDYQAPNTDPGFIDAFFSAASQNEASTLSTSWGESETIVAGEVASGEETSAYEAAFDEAFLELADQGTSVFDAAGDQAAYDAENDIGTTNLAVDTPADSPYATASGGTTTPWTGTISGSAGTASVTVPNQRAWGWDYLWAPVAAVDGETFAQAATANVVGGGGGYSVVERKPSYQYLVSGTSNFHGVKYLTPTDFLQVAPNLVEPTQWSVTSTPPLVSGAGSGRAVPDVSADADPFSGYLLYEPSFAGVGQPVLQAGWGGTSFVGPQFNGSTAVIDSVLGHRVGLWNPSLYAFAGRPGSPVTPLNQVGTGNDNIFFTGNPGQQYNSATGLGVPDLAKFAADLARGR